MTGIEKFQRDERIRNAIYKHKADVTAIANELGIDIKIVRKVVAELKDKMDDDIKFNLAYLIMGKICSGYSQVESVLGDAFSALTEHATFEGSLCCNKPAYTREEGNEVVTYCGKCNKRIAETHIVPNLAVYRMIHDFGKQLDVHYDALVSFAKDMGFTASEGTTLIRQNNIIISDGADYKKAKEVVSSVVDEELLQDIDKLTPQERRHIAQRIEHKIIESKIVEEKE